MVERATHNTSGSPPFPLFKDSEEVLLGVISQVQLRKISAEAGPDSCPVIKISMESLLLNSCESHVVLMSLYT